MGVTAVLNAAQGSMQGWNYVNTKESYYTRCNIQFFGVPALDVKHYPINQHFNDAANFIEAVLRNKGILQPIYIHIYINIISKINILSLKYLFHFQALFWFIALLGLGKYNNYWEDRIRYKYDFYLK